MAMLFGLLLSTLFPVVFAQAKNYSLSPEGAEQASKLYGEFNSQLNETESTSHTTGHGANHTVERGRTESTRESSDLGDNSQKTRAFWDHTDGIRGLTTTMSHAESNKSLPDTSSSRSDNQVNGFFLNQSSSSQNTDVLRQKDGNLTREQSNRNADNMGYAKSGHNTGSGVTLDYTKHNQSSESSLLHAKTTQMSGDDLRHTESQTSSSADSIRSTGVPPYDTKNKESTESSPDKGTDVLTGNRTVHQSTDPILDLTTISESTGTPDRRTKDSDNIRDIESHTESMQYVSTLGNHDYSSSSTKESITPTTQKPAKPTASDVFRWTSKIKGHWIARVNIGLCSHSIYFGKSLLSSTVISQELWLDTSLTERTFVQCQMMNSLPRGYYVNVTVDQLKGPYDGNFTLTLSEKGEKDEIPSPIVIDSVILRNTDVSMVSTNTMKWFFESHAPFKPLVVTIHFSPHKSPYIRTLPIFHMSATVSYVISPGFNEKRNYPHNYDGEFLLKITDGESLVVSVSPFNIEDDDECQYDYVLLTEVPQNKTRELCGNLDERIQIYHSSLRIYFHTDDSYASEGFKLMFSVLPRSQEPKPLPGNVFNCSVPHFHRFEPLLSCNMLKECQGGEDEHNCSYHSKECGKGYIDAGDKCYRLVRPNRTVTWLEARNDCNRQGQNLITFKTAEEFAWYRHMLFYVAKRVRSNFIGLQTVSWSQAPSVATMYRNIWQWVTGWTAFIFQDASKTHRSTCVYYNPHSFYDISCGTKLLRDYFCEFDKGDAISRSKIMTVLIDRQPATLSRLKWNVSVVQCPLGHVTRDFQACDFQAECFAAESLNSCEAHAVKIPMFLCQETGEAIHYSLVCDHKQHCPDNSDEKLCWYPPCASTLGFSTCENGQCFADHHVCDGKVNCYDGSDEVCSVTDKHLRFATLTFPPGSVYLDGAGGYWVEKQESNRCPPKHFLCPNYYCLPIYLRCNGIEDCPGREDEAGCDSYTCPGFYRCRGSKVCLHADNVCDGVPQCPEQDDELLCDLSCPDQCHCQGLAFVCSTSFSASSYPALRYLDASGSSMTPDDFTDNLYLIHLRLTGCDIVSLPGNTTFPNLQQLDLSWNKLSHLDIGLFYNMANLRVLVLAGNPLLHIVDSDSPEVEATKLCSIDLSHTALQLVSGSAFISCPDLKTLNISWSRITTISNEGFKFTSKLETFDSRGSPLKYFPDDLLRGLHFLKSVQTDNYKLCCDAILPASFNLKNCHTVRNLIASCEDLLRSNIYRTFLWIFALLSIVGNIGSFAARVYLNTDSRVMGSFSTFVTNLSIADLCMGVYLAIVGVADLVYRGEYLWHDDEWKKSTACKIAGFLSLLSSEVSAFMICLITLDRFIVLRFPFSRRHFRRTSSLITCGAVWLVGLALAAVPLLPMTSHWEFYSQTGICIPLPFASSEGFPGYNYSFSVMILLNLVLFLFIAVGQALVFWSIRTNTMSADTRKKLNEIKIARRLITVVVSDFLCWFPIGLLGVLSATGTPIPGEVNVAVAIFVLPFNSALNPFLYTFNVVMEKRNKAQEGHLLRRLESRMHTETSCSCRMETANVAAIQLELNQHITGDMQDEER